jgi:hypothetical protein
VRENLLILDTPEYLREPDIIRGRRHERINTDLRIDRLAVPRFPMASSGNGEDTEVTEDTSADLDQHNLGLNADLEAIFSTYPYEYKMVDYDFEEENLRKKGFQFILMRLYTTSDMILKLLEYKDDGTSDTQASSSSSPDETTSKKSIPSNQPVYKYYIKHIHTGDVYLGETWDAAPTWQKALSNHLNYILNRLEENK